MYEITCPHCGKDTMCWENGTCPFGDYFPVDCENCQKAFFIQRRSWFDTTYDNFNVDVKTEEELIKMGAVQKSATIPPPGVYGG